MSAICLDCFDRTASATARVCPACRSPRLRRHAELEQLSISHIDCDAFYASIEKRDDPSLADKPLIIGGGKRGVVSTACYIARTFGVKSAMPMYKALKACPDAVVIKPNFEKYVPVSRTIKRLMLETTPLVQSLSLDEAFLDLTGTERLHRQPPVATLARLARRIEDACGITVSIGLSYNKFLAKFSSDLDKPRGLAIIGHADAKAVLAPRPPSVIFGVGKAFMAKLEADGLLRLAQVQAMPRENMFSRYGSMGAHIWDLAQGDDSRIVDPERDAKGLSAETTFNDDISDLDELSRILWSLSEKVSARCKAAGQGGSTIQLKLRQPDFRILTRRTTLPGPTQLGEVIFQQAQRLLHATANGKARFRLIGVGVSNIAPAEDCDVFDLFKADEKKQADAERAMDAVRQKFGSGAILKGRAI